MVSAAPAEAVVAAAHFTLGLVPGATRPALGVVVKGRLGSVVLCDAGAATSASADELVQFAIAGSAFAVAGLGVARPRVGLLSARPALVDSERSAADAALSAVGVEHLTYVGPLGADVLATGGGVDVAVTDGFTGDVLLAGVSSGRDAVAVVLGVSGVAVCVHPSSPDGGDGPPKTARSLFTEPPEARVPASPGAAAGEATSGVSWAQAIATAATVQRTALVGSVRTAMSGLLARRRVAAGMAR
jgi:glycerol-3-phosphate acyltransferase PlsX